MKTMNEVDLLLSDNSNARTSRQQNLRDHVRRSLGRVAVRRALQACHIMTIEGRGSRQWFLGSAA
jgi:hypothetical protein